MQSTENEDSVRLDLDAINKRHTAWVQIDPALATWAEDWQFVYPISPGDDAIRDQISHYIVEVDVPMLLDALAAERDRADRAARVVQEIRDYIADMDDMFGLSVDAIIDKHREATA